MNDQEYVGLFMNVLNDKQNRTILTGLINTNSSFYELPFFMFGESEIATLVRIHQLEELGLVSSEMILKNDAYYNIYTTTRLGKCIDKLIEKYKWVK